MEKKLAIKGHSTRSNEVIKLLEMLGGTNLFSNNGDVIGHKETNCYYISENVAAKYISWDYIGPEEIDKYKIFTLEEFLEKYPFKVGDFVRIPEYESEVRILKMKWCPVSEHIEYLVCPNDEDEWFTTDELLEDNDNPNKTRDCKKCGLGFGSVRCFDKDCPHNTPKSYAVGLKDGKAIDCKVNKETDMNTCKDTAREAHKKVAYLSINDEDYADQIEINLGDNYEYKFEMNRLYILKKKPKYPETYKECCKVLKKDPDIVLEICRVSTEESLLFSKLIRLKRCRDAYWKIAGEQMGLDKSWEPDWNEETNKFIISNKCNKIYLNNTAWYAEVLSFPTAEMRDAFYENFKDLIESCKELL